MAAATEMQWRAYEAVYIEGKSQTAAARLFGVCRSAITRRIARYLVATNQPRMTCRRRRVVRAISLSAVENL